MIARIFLGAALCTPLFGQAAVRPQPANPAPIARPAPAPIARPAPAPAPIARPAPMPAPIARPAPMPSPIARPAPTPPPVRVNPVSPRPAPISQPAPVRPNPISQPAPISRPTPITRPAPITRPTPIESPIGRPAPQPVRRPNPITVPDDPVARTPAPAPSPSPTPITNPPRRRTVPFDGVTPRPNPVPVPAPDDGRQRRRYEREIGDLPPARPAPVAPPVNRGPGDISVPRRPITPTPTRPNPITPANPVAPPRVTPRYRGADNTPGLAPVERNAPATSPTRRGRTPWTEGRSDRQFNNGKPWGRTAGGQRNFGTWRWTPISSWGYQFWWGAPGWCQWGIHSWPTYYGWCWPRYWNAWDCSFGYTTNYWCNWNPYYTARQQLWYWPSNVYAPSPVVNNYYYDDTDDSSSGVTIYVDGGAEVVRGDSDAVHITVGEVGTAAARGRATPSKETLAERHVVLADNYFREGRYQDAVENYKRALSFLPEDASIHFALADALFALGDYHYAAFMIGKALELDPGLAEVNTDKRTFYGDAKAFTAQLDTLVRYTAERPYDAAAQLVLGFNLRFSGDRDGAERAFRRVLEIDKHSEPAELFLAAIAKQRETATKDAAAKDAAKLAPVAPGATGESK